MRSRESQILHDHFEKHYALQRDKEAWLNERLTEACPEWLIEYKSRFEYNTVHDFWRRSYYGKTRDLIRAYEMLAGKLDVGSGYELLIMDNYLYVKPPSRDNHNRYQRLLDNTPMLAPYESYEIWDFKDESSENGFLCGSFSTVLKSHAFRCHNRKAFVKLGSFYADRLGADGYSTRMLTKGRGRSAEYAMVLTHNTETPDACVESLIADGYVPFVDKPKDVSNKSQAGLAQVDLKAREKELLDELAAVRQKMSAQLEQGDAE